MFKNLYKITIVITGGSGDIAKAIQELIVSSQNSTFFQVLCPCENILDVTKEEKVRNFFNDTGECILINCAGILFSNPVKDIEFKEWKEQIDVNLNGAFLCSKYAIKNGCKRIINICSTSSFMGRGNWAAYGAAKAGLLSLTESLRAEGIYCQALCFGRTNTNLRRKIFPNEDTSKIMQPKRVAEIVYKTILNKFANAEIIYFDINDILIGDKSKVLNNYILKAKE